MRFTSILHFKILRVQLYMFVYNRIVLRESMHGCWSLF